MKYIILLIASLVVLLACNHTSPPQDRVEKCDCIDTVAVTSGRNFFPFNKSTKIVAYQFFGHYNYSHDTFSDSLTDSLKLLGNVFQRKIINKKILTPEQTLLLEKVFYNRIRVCDDGQLTSAHDCGFDPHHGFIFYGDKDNPIADIELCFICEDYRSNPSKSFGPLCGWTYCDLRMFYKDMGFDTTALMLEECPGYNFK
jgi:hypothetical protein